MNKQPNRLLNEYGKTLSVKKPLSKQAFGQFGSIYEYPNYGRFRWRNYVNQDTEVGSSTLTRDLLTRWSREQFSQCPWLFAAIKILAQFVVGSEYKFKLNVTNNTNQAWWNKSGVPFITEYMTNPTVKGSHFDFNTLMFVCSMMIDQDGDYGTIFGKQDGKIQLVPTHRIGSQMNSRISSNDTQIMAGPLPNTIMSDGVCYNYQGKPLGFNVINADNMVNSMLGNTENMFYSAKDMTLTYDSRFFDRGRGFPSISSGIIQALSLQESESYIFEGIKIQQMYAVVEKTPSGEGPEEEADIFDSIMSGNINTTSPNAVTAPSTGMQVIDGPSMKYVSVNGGDVKNMTTDAVATETANFLTKCKAEILASMGIPETFVFSPNAVSGRMSDGVCKLFNSTIKQRQKILDKYGKLIIVQALTKAMQNGDIEENWDENLYEAIDFTHPPIVSLNDSYDRQDNLDYFKAGLLSMNDITMKAFGKTSEQVINEIAKDVTLFTNAAKQVVKDTGGDPNDSTQVEKVEAKMREQANKTAMPAPNPNDLDNNKEDEK